MDHGDMGDMPMDDKPMKGCHMDMPMDHSMSMTFGARWNETAIVFPSWKARTTGQYVGAWFALFFIALFFRLLFVLRAAFEYFYASKQYARRGYNYLNAVETTNLSDSSKSPESSSSEIREQANPLSSNSRFWKVPVVPTVDIGRCLFTFVIAMVSYFLMLAAMTFVTGYFFAIITGLAVGELLLGRFGLLVGAAGSVCAH